METRLIVAYCLCDDIVKNSGICQQKHAKMNLAEVMATSLAAAMFFCGNQELARKFMVSGKYVSYMLSKSQFNRRPLSIQRSLWLAVFEKIAEEFKRENVSKEFLVDSFPIAVCHLDTLQARMNFFMELGFTCLQPKIVRQWNFC